MKKIGKVLSEVSSGSTKRITKAEFMAMVQKKAYELYEKDGRKQGNDVKHWLTAERLVKEELSRK
jgi:hypothetical protein